MSRDKHADKEHNVPSGIERVRRLLFASSDKAAIEVREDEAALGVARYIAELDQVQEDLTRAFFARR